MLGLGLPLTNHASLGPVSLASASYLLDDYSGASAAYSLRKLSSSYSGSAIRVRREDTSIEQDIGFDASGNLDTSALATFCSGTNGFVTTWYDQASSNNVTQTSEPSQPKIYDSKTGLITENGKPAVYFDGTDDGLNSSSDLRSTAGASTVIQVRNVDRAAGFQQPFVFHKIQRHIIERVGQTGYDTVSLSTNETSGEFMKFVNADVTSQLLHFTTWDGSTQVGGVDEVVLYENGSEVSGSARISGFGVTASGTNSIGYRADTNSQYCVGTFQEVIVYTSDESSNRTGIETNINDFYSIYT